MKLAILFSAVLHNLSEEKAAMAVGPMGAASSRHIWIKCDNTDHLWSLMLFFSGSFANRS